MNEEEKKAIEELEEFIKGPCETCKYCEAAYKLNRKNIIQLLNLTKKLQKENEELKQDRNNNYQMIALAQNEALGYMQGYEDGKKLKRSAVANIVENQQYYIFNKQIEHYKEYIVKLQKENEKLKNKLLDTLEGQKVIEEETPQYIKENYIPKSKVEETIAELVKEYKDILSDYGNIDTNLIINIPNENVKKHCEKLVEKIIVLQELIEGSED